MMLDADLVRPLTEIPPPVLTVYLNTNPAQSRNHTHPPGYLIWLKSQAKALAATVAEEERAALEEQFDRVHQHVDRNPPAGRGAVFFAGPHVWLFFALKVDVEDEVSWGLASLTQLLWLVDEHRACGLVLADHAGARFFRYWMGEVTEHHEAALEIDTGEWRRKDLMPPSQPGTEVSRGSQRDSFEHRVEAQVERFYAREAVRIREWAERFRLNPVFLSGPAELVELIVSELPKGMRDRFVGIGENWGYMAPSELQTRVETQLKRWESENERNLLDWTLGNSHGVQVVLGVENVLDRLQQGLVYRIVTVRGFDGPARQCVHCGWTGQGSDNSCPACGAEWRLTALRAVLPILARRYNASVEIVADQEGKLRQAGGVGGWLR